ncbi:MAG TPA: MFS transporter [Acidobacteriaceae bacterium]|nr:MFS transporter [Acidobacteriaceae bacterium]
MRQIRNLRWWVAGLLACASALSYLDRQSFPVAVTEIQKHIAVSDRQYSVLQMLFLLSYSAMYAGGGKIADWLGTRLGYTILIVWWSAATILHGLVSSVAGLGVGRFLLGLGEGGGFPCSAKAVSEWFPPEDRAFAFGIFNTGSSIGAVAAPPLIALIILTLSWRWVFFITGTLGILWAFAWWLFYELPQNQKRITAEELDRIRNSLSCASSANSLEGKQISWLQLFGYPQVWALLTAKFLTDAAWFFFIFWLPKYLGDVRHLNIKQIGYFAWIPYAAAGMGSFLGGWLSSILVRHRLTINTSRKICLGLSAGLMPVSIWITRSPLGWTLLFFSIAFLGHQFWSTILQTLAADIFPSAVVGSVAGLMGAVGSFGAMLFDLLVGSILTYTHSYASVFLLAGVLHPLAFVTVLVLIRKIEPVAPSANVAATG